VLALLVSLIASVVVARAVYSPHRHRKRRCRKAGSPMPRRWAWASVTPPNQLDDVARCAELALVQAVASLPSNVP